MALDYNEARRVYSDKLAASPEGWGRIEAAMLAMCEFVYKRGLEDGQKMAQDADRKPEVFSRS